MSVTTLARKPVIRNVEGTDILSEIKKLERQAPKRLVNLYIPDAGTHIMFYGSLRKMIWHGAWAPLTLEEAVECAREQAYEKGIATKNNLFFVPQGFDRGESGYLWADVDADRECLDIEALAKYQDRGDDCLLVLYDPACQEVQQYRLRNGLCEWWWKGCPHPLEAAKRIANREREERRLTLDQLHFINVTTPMQ